MVWFCTKRSENDLAVPTAADELNIKNEATDLRNRLNAPQRIAAALKAKQNGQTWHNVAAQPSIQYCIDRQEAKQLLERHEDGRHRDDDSTATTSRPSFLLHKPPKHNALLDHALTNSNGDTWRRQRPLIELAFNDRQVKALVRDYASSGIPWTELVQNEGRIDARQLALEFATRTMVVAVFTERYLKQIQGPLLAIFLTTLQLRRNGPAETMALCSVVHRIVPELQHNPPTSPCLARLLLDQEPNLTRPEVIDNIHSALLAGTQTIATAMTAAVLLNETTTSSIAESTGRVRCIRAIQRFPPVASLPRCRVSVDSPHERLDDDLIIIDTLAFAHQDVSMNQATGCSAPWGIGDRSCPAGSLSVEAVAAGLESLDKLFFVRRSVMSDKWIQSLVYNPTLTFQEPVWIDLQAKK